MIKVSKEQANRITSSLDRLASLLEKHGSSLGLDSETVANFVTAADTVADAIDGKTANFDAETIGEKVPGPIENDKNEPWMNGEFTQEEKHNVGELYTKHADFDPSTIGKQVAGPKEGDSDEDYMKGEFTQKEKSELQKWQQGRVANMRKVMASDNPVTPREWEALKLKEPRYASLEDEYLKLWMNSKV